MKNTKLVIIISLVAIVLALGVFLVLRHLNSDGRVVERTYSSITWPSYLTLTDKRSEDERKYDPQLEFQWHYTYAIKSDLSHDRIKEEVQDSLKNQGYKTVLEYKNTTPDQYSFEAEGKGIMMTVIIGDKPNTQNKDRVLVTARISD